MTRPGVAVNYLDRSQEAWADRFIEPITAPFLFESPVVTSNIQIDAGCRAGSCGSFETAIRAGSVRYLETPGYECSAGSCLPCVCVPSEELELDA